MWERTGFTVETAYPRVTLHGVTSDSGEGDALDVELGGRVIARVQEYSATIELGKGLTHHGSTWAATPLDSSSFRWAKTRRQTVFGLRTRDDAVSYSVRNF